MDKQLRKMWFFLIFGIFPELVGRFSVSVKSGFCAFYRSKSAPFKQMRSPPSTHIKHPSYWAGRIEGPPEPVLASSARHCRDSQSLSCGLSCQNTGPECYQRSLSNLAECIRAAVMLSPSPLAAGAAAGTQPAPSLGHRTSSSSSYWSARKFGEVSASFPRESVHLTSSSVRIKRCIW